MNQTFINCDFEYECPKDWFGLEPTNKTSIKHCKECKKDVHLCMNQEELDYAITEKHCVAYFQDPSLQTRFKLSREKCEVNKTDPEFLSHTLMGMPKGASGGIEKLLDSTNNKDDDVST